MKRFAVLMFGVSVYVLFLGVFLYAVGFVGNFLAPTRLDGVAQLPICLGWGLSITGVAGRGFAMGTLCSRIEFGRA